MQATTRRRSNQCNDSDIVLFVCDKCKKGFKKEIEFRKHARKCGQSPMGQPLPLGTAMKPKTNLENKTSDISRKKPTPNRLTKAANPQICLQKVVFMCNICLRGFRGIGVLEEHLRTHKKNDSETTVEKSNNKLCIKKPEESLFMCGLCGILFNTNDELQAHFRVHTEDSGEKSDEVADCKDIEDAGTKCNEYVCGICDKSYVDKMQFQKHTRIHIGINTHFCDVCGAGFPSRRELNSHKATTRHNKPFMCRVCGMLFSEEYFLEKHASVHITVKQYMCSLCGKTFDSSMTLHKHIEEHGKQVQASKRNLPRRTQRIKGHHHNCDFCDKVMPLGKTGLRAHMRLSHKRHVKKRV